MKCDSPPSVDRTLAILSAFRGENTPQRPAEIAHHLRIPRSSAYRIIRTLLAKGYLEKVARGRVRLGPRFDMLLAAYQYQHRMLRVAPDKSGHRCAREADRLPNPVARSFLWNPRLTEMVNCRRLYRSPPYRIGFSNASTSNPWRVAMLHAMLGSAKAHANRIEQFIARDGEDDPAKQSEDIESLLRENIDLLLVSCNQTDLTDRALARAADARVPVIVVDRRPRRDDSFLTCVSASDIALGRITAQWLAERLNGRGVVFMLAGVEGASPTEQRVAAANEVFQQYSDIVLTPVHYTRWREEVGRATTQRLIDEFGIPAGVWCDSGLQGAGSMQAFLDLGLSNSEIPPHTGGDVNHAFQLAARHEIPLAAVEYPAWMGARALQSALDVLSGRTMPRHVEVHSQVVVSRGAETASIHPDILVEDYVRWDRPAHFVASHGLSEDYNPDQFHP